MTTQLSSINLFEFPSITLLQNENQSDLNDLPLGGITEDNRYSWIYCGPHIEIRLINDGSKIASWTFGANAQDYNSEITCVLDIPGSDILIIGLENEISSLVCLFDIQSSVVIKAIRFPNKVNAFSLIHSCPDYNNFLPKCYAPMSGIIAVGLSGGHLILLDLCLNDICNNDLENKKDENNPVNLLALTNFDLEAAENAKKHASQNSDHICIILNEQNINSQEVLLDYPDVQISISRESADITALHYMSPNATLAVGLDCGVFQLWNLITMEPLYTSKVTKSSPIQAFGFLEPIDDPIKQCYLWVCKQDDLASMYSLNYKKTQPLNKSKHNNNLGNEDLAASVAETSNASSTFYQELCDCRLCLTLDLRNFSENQISSKLVSCRTLHTHKFITNEEDICELSLCMFHWYAQASASPINESTSSFFTLFELGQWYKEQMPSTISKSSCNSFMNTITAPNDAFDIRIKPSSISTFHTVQPLDEHFYPTSLDFELITLREISLELSYHLGSQRELIYQLEATGPSALLHPTTLYHRCLAVGLRPTLQDTSSSHNTNSLETQRRFLLSLALEHQLTSLLLECMNQWIDGTQLSANCSASMLITWGWDRTESVKAQIEILAKPLFDSTQNGLDENGKRLFDYYFNQLNQLHKFFQHCQTLELDVDRESHVLGVLSTFVQVVQWFLQVGFLPERTEFNSNSSHIPYPINKIKQEYQQRRINQPELFIDVLVKSEPKLVTFFKSCGGSGLYPPVSLHAVLRSYLLDTSDPYVKHCIVMYILLDLASILDENRYKTAIDRFISFPARLHLKPSIIKLTHSFWLLDHKEIEASLEILSHPSISLKEMESWQIELMVQGLLSHQLNHEALVFLESHSGGMAKANGASGFHQKIFIRVLLANRMAREAFELIRTISFDSNSGQALLRDFFQECDRTGQLASLLQLSLTPHEERELSSYLEQTQQERRHASATIGLSSTHVENNNSSYSGPLDPRALYYLQRSRILEAMDVRSGVPNSSSPPSTLISAREKNYQSIPSNEDIISAYSRTLPSVTRKLAKYVYNKNACYDRLQVVTSRPVPFSSVVKANVKQNIIYKSSIVRTALEKARETWFSMTESPNEFIEENKIATNENKLEFIPFLFTDRDEMEHSQMNMSLMNQGTPTVLPKMKRRKRDTSPDVQESACKRYRYDNDNLNHSSNIVPSLDSRPLRDPLKLLETPKLAFKLDSKVKNSYTPLQKKHDVTPHSILKVRDRERSSTPFSLRSSISDNDTRSVGFESARQIRFSLPKSTSPSPESTTNSNATKIALASARRPLHPFSLETNLSTRQSTTCFKSAFENKNEKSLNVTPGPMKMAQGPHPRQSIHLVNWESDSVSEEDLSEKKDISLNSSEGEFHSFEESDNNMVVDEQEKDHVILPAASISSSNQSNTKNENASSSPILKFLENLEQYASGTYTKINKTSSSISKSETIQNDNKIESHYKTEFQTKSLFVNKSSKNVVKKFEKVSTSSEKLSSTSMNQDFKDKTNSAKINIKEIGPSEAKLLNIQVSKGNDETQTVLPTNKNIADIIPKETAATINKLTEENFQNTVKKDAKIIPPKHLDQVKAKSNKEENEECEIIEIDLESDEEDYDDDEKISKSSSDKFKKAFLTDSGSDISKNDDEISNDPYQLSDEEMYLENEELEEEEEESEEDKEEQEENIENKSKEKKINRKLDISTEESSNNEYDDEEEEEEYEHLEDEIVESELDYEEVEDEEYSDEEEFSQNKKSKTKSKNIPSEGSSIIECEDDEDMIATQYLEDIVESDLEEVENEEENDEENDDDIEEINDISSVKEIEEENQSESSIQEESNNDEIKSIQDEYLLEEVELNQEEIDDEIIAEEVYVKSKTPSIQEESDNESEIREIQDENIVEEQLIEEELNKIAQEINEKCKSSSIQEESDKESEVQDDKEEIGILHEDTNTNASLRRSLRRSTSRSSLHTLTPLIEENVEQVSISKKSTPRRTRRSLSESIEFPKTKSLKKIKSTSSLNTLDEVSDFKEKNDEKITTEEEVYEKSKTPSTRRSRSQSIEFPKTKSLKKIKSTSSLNTLDEESDFKEKNDEIITTEEVYEKSKTPSTRRSRSQSIEFPKTKSLKKIKSTSSLNTLDEESDFKEKNDEIITTEEEVYEKSKTPSTRRSRSQSIEFPKTKSLKKIKSTSSLNTLVEVSDFKEKSKIPSIQEISDKEEIHDENLLEEQAMEEENNEEIITTEEVYEKSKTPSTRRSRSQSIEFPKTKSLKKIKSTSSLNTLVEVSDFKEKSKISSIQEISDKEEIHDENLLEEQAMEEENNEEIITEEFNDKKSKTPELVQGVANDNKNIIDELMETEVISEAENKEKIIEEEKLIQEIEVSSTINEPKELEDSTPEVEAIPLEQLEKDTTNSADHRIKNKLPSSVTNFLEQKPSTSTTRHQRRSVSETRNLLPTTSSRKRPRRNSSSSLYLNDEEDKFLKRIKTTENQEKKEMVDCNEPGPSHMLPEKEKEEMVDCNEPGPSRIVPEEEKKEIVDCSQPGPSRIVPEEEVRSNIKTHQDDDDNKAATPLKKRIPKRASSESREISGKLTRKKSFHNSTSSLNETSFQNEDDDYKHKKYSLRSKKEEISSLQEDTNANSPKGDLGLRRSLRRSTSRSSLLTLTPLIEENVPQVSLSKNTEEKFTPRTPKRTTRSQSELLEFPITKSLKKIKSTSSLNTLVDVTDFKKEQNQKYSEKEADEMSEECVTQFSPKNENSEDVIMLSQQSNESSVIEPSQNRIKFDKKVNEDIESDTIDEDTESNVEPDLNTIPFESNINPREESSEVTENTIKITEKNLENKDEEGEYILSQASSIEIEPSQYRVMQEKERLLELNEINKETIAEPDSTIKLKKKLYNPHDANWEEISYDKESQDTFEIIPENTLSLSKKKKETEKKTPRRVTRKSTRAKSMEPEEPIVENPSDNETKSETSGLRYSRRSKRLSFDITLPAITDEEKESPEIINTPQTNEENLEEYTGSRRLTRIQRKILTRNSSSKFFSPSLQETTSPGNNQKLETSFDSVKKTRNSRRLSTDFDDTSSESSSRSSLRSSIRLREKRNKQDMEGGSISPSSILTGNDTEDIEVTPKKTKRVRTPSASQSQSEGSSRLTRQSKKQEHTQQTTEEMSSPKTSRKKLSQEVSDEILSQDSPSTSRLSLTSPSSQKSTRKNLRLSLLAPIVEEEVSSPEKQSSSKKGKQIKNLRKKSKKE